MPAEQGRSCGACRWSLLLKNLLIVYHPRTGGTLQMVQAAVVGASRELAVAVQLKTCVEAGPEDLLQADAYLFACPENLAAMSGPMKDFFDRTYYPVLDRIQGRPYATLICAGSDGSNAARQIERIATGWRLKAIAEPLIVCTHADTGDAILAAKHIGAADLTRCEELAATLAAGLGFGIY
jgi:NAD(P)H-dependent FMN reductase